MLPALLTLGIEAIESEAVINAITWGLGLLGFSIVSHQLGIHPLKKEEDKKEQKVDVFQSVPKVDFLGGANASSSSVSSSSEATEEEAGENYEGIGGYPSYDDSLPSVNGDSLIDVLRSSGENTASNIRAVANSIDALRSELVRVRASIESISGNRTQTQSDTYRQEVLQALKGLGLVLGGIGLSLEGIRQRLDSGLVIDLPQEVKDSAISTKRVMDKLTERVSINPENAITEGTPIDFLTHFAGIQAKTFSDINSFDLDSDLPDLPDSGIDISQIFRFLKVSEQIQNNQT